MEIDGIDVSGVRDDGGGQKKGSARLRKMSARVAEVMVDEGTRKRVATARLDALENDYVAADMADDDDEYELPQDDDGIGVVKSKKGGYQVVRKRQTRQSLAAAAGRAASGAAMRRTAKTFADLLAEARLHSLPPSHPSYITAAVGPPLFFSPSHLCSVCGAAAPYTCPLCTSRFCTAACQAMHRETRCLKFVA